MRKCDTKGFSPELCSFWMQNVLRASVKSIAVTKLCEGKNANGLNSPRLTKQLSETETCQGVFHWFENKFKKICSFWTTLEKSGHLTPFQTQNRTQHLTTAVKLRQSQCLDLRSGTTAKLEPLGTVHRGAGAQTAKHCRFKGYKASVNSSKASLHWMPWETLVSCFLPPLEKGEGKTSSQNPEVRTWRAAGVCNSYISLYFYFPDCWGCWGWRWVFWEAVPLCSCVFELMG